MSDVTAGYNSFQGLLIPDPRITSIDRDQSTLTEAGPRPGVPEPQVQTRMVLQSLGAQAAAKKLRVKTSKAGFPGPDGAGFTFYYEGDSNERGADVPTITTYWEAVRWLDGSTATATGASNLDCIALADRTVLIAAEVSATSPATQDMVQVSARDPDTGTWASPVTVYTQTGGYSAGRGAHPCMVQLPSGRVYLWHWVELASGDMQVRQHYSDDAGATWAVGSKYCLPTPVEYEAEGSGVSNYDTMGRLRAALYQGDVLLVASLRLAADNVGAADVRDVFRQYASRDLGASFIQVAESTDADNEYTGKHQDIVVHNGRLILAWCSAKLTAQVAVSVVLPSPWRDFTAVSTVSITNGEQATELTAAATSGDQVSDSDLALVSADDGVLYLIHRATSFGGTHTDEGLIARSTDNGVSWAYPGQSDIATIAASTWWTCGDAATHPRDFSGCWLDGRILLAHHWDANPGDEDNSIGALYLGGPSTVTMPGYGSTTPSAASRVSWTKTWLPFDEPSDCGWTGGGTGGTVTLAAGGLNVVTAAKSDHYTDNPAGTIAEGLILRARFEVVSGGSLTTDDVGLRLRLADGTNDYDVSIRATDSAIRVYDNNAGSAVGSDISLLISPEVELFIAMAGSSIVVRYRVGPDSDSDRVWFTGPSSTTLTSDTSTPAANHMVRWSHIASSTAESNWYELHYVSDEYTGDQLIDFTNPDDLFPRSYARTGVYVDGGTKVQAVDGPTLVGDLWHINTRADYAVDRVLPSVAASPRIPWRSTGETVHRIALPLDPALTVASLSGNTIIGVGIFGANFRTGSIEGDTGGGTWVPIATFDAAKELTTMAYVRAGNSVDADAGSTDQPYLYMNEAAGWTVDLGSSKLRRVKWNTEGKWDTTGKKARLFLEGCDDSEPSSGTMSLWPSDFVVILRPNSTAYAGYRLVIDAQSTVDGYFELGSLVVGPVATFGNVYSWGRVIELTPNVDVDESPDGTDRTRKRGPARRGVSLAWEDGVDLSDASGTEPTPDYLATSTKSGTEPAASVGDTPLLIQGLLHLLDGPRTPLVYLPNIPKGSASVDSHVLNRLGQHVYGRLDSPVRIESVQGEELEDEVVRVGQILIRELV